MDDTVETYIKTNTLDFHPLPPPAYRSECYDFRELKLTAFQALFADDICYLETMSHYDQYMARQYHDDLQGLQIASLVLSAITVLSLIIFMVYRLFTYTRQRKSEQQLHI